MPTQTKSSARPGRRAKQQRPGKRPAKKTARPSFGEWARSVAGMMKDGPPDLSMREGFGR
jgi:hypothetical protein